MQGQRRILASAARTIVKSGVGHDCSCFREVERFSSLPRSGGRFTSPESGVILASKAVSPGGRDGQSSSRVPGMSIVLSADEAAFARSRYSVSTHGCRGDPFQSLLSWIWKLTAGPHVTRVWMQMNPVKPREYSFYFDVLWRRLFMSGVWVSADRHPALRIWSAWRAQEVPRPSRRRASHGKHRHRSRSSRGRNSLGGSPKRRDAVSAAYDVRHRFRLDLPLIMAAVPAAGHIEILIFAEVSQGIDGPIRAPA